MVKPLEMLSQSQIYDLHTLRFLVLHLWLMNCVSAISQAVRSYPAPPVCLYERGVPHPHGADFPTVNGMLLSRLVV